MLILRTKRLLRRNCHLLSRKNMLGLENYQSICVLDQSRKTYRWYERMHRESIGPHVDSDSSEWDLLEHYLMLCTRTSRCTLARAVRLDAAPVSAENLKGWSKGLKSIFVWVNMDDLDESNDLSNIVRRGFFIPKNQGMKFVHGNVIIPSLPLVNDNHTHNGSVSQNLSSSLRLLLCEIVLGNCLHVDHETDAIVENLLSDYNSFYIRYPKDDMFFQYKADIFSTSLHEENYQPYCTSLTYTFPEKNSLDLATPQVVVLPSFAFRSHYVIFRSSQVTVRYIVEAKISPRSPEDFGLPVCENCNIEPANVWCKVDSACLCTLCDDQLHTSSKLASRHLRVPLSERPRENGSCQKHPTQVYSYYCMECEESLCNLCVSRCHHLLAYMEKSNVSPFEQNVTLDGLKKQPSVLDHTPILPIREATVLIHPQSSPCEEAPYAELLKRSTENVHHIRLLRGKVEQNIAALREQTDVAVDNAFQQLENICQHRTQSLLGNKNTLNLALELVQNSHKFIQYLKSALPPSDFLISWLRYQRYNSCLLESFRPLDEDILHDAVAWVLINVIFFDMKNVLHKENLRLDGSLKFHAV